MKLGFVSAIFPELSLEEVFQYAQGAGFSCVELMCWPPGKADRRYAGVTHVGVTSFPPDDASRLNALAAKYGVAISGLGYYPNALSADRDEAELAVAHLRKVIDAAAQCGVNLVNTFAGRNPALSVEASW